LLLDAEGEFKARGGREERLNELLLDAEGELKARASARITSGGCRLMMARSKSSR
jgi:hypothetical protein